MEYSPIAQSSGPTWLLKLVLVAAVLAGVLYWKKDSGSSASRATQHAGVGQMLEPIAVEPLLNTEQRWHQENLQGQVVLLNYWGPWCPPCRLELPELLELQREYRDSRQVRILLVSDSGGAQQSEEELRTDTRETILDHDPAAAIYHDPSGKTRSALVRSARLAQFGYPTTLVVDQQGRIAGVWQGYGPHYVREMGKVIQQLLKKQAS